MSVFIKINEINGVRLTKKKYKSDKNKNENKKKYWMKNLSRALASMKCFENRIKFEFTSL